MKVSASWIGRCAPMALLWRARLVHALGSLRWPGWLALALLVAAGAVLAGTMALDTLEAQRESALATARQAYSQARAMPERSAANGDVEALLVRFEPQEKLADFVEELHRRAAQYKVGIDHAEYRAQADLRGRALRYEIVLPARGSYPNLRNWLTAVLHDHRGATLLEFSVRRAGEGVGQLDAHVRLAAYLRSAP